MTLFHRVTLSSRSEAMDGPSCPPVRWRCRRESWVDPMEEEAICHTNGGNFPVEVKQTKRNKEADSVGFAQELTMTSNKKCQNEPVIGHQPGTNGESSKFQDRNRVLSTKTAKLQLLEICIANCWNPPSFILSKEDGSDLQKRQVCQEL
ncbi:uncharacterized protein LOC135675151 isoform X2 [Musa acuminata AAA Group]|uniref:uncharacterized protein LOC135638637 isoform X2 n=1 Tax=Musa acuminata AAA Group TaxID=214697 RepID=UPI0031D874AF